MKILLVDDTQTMRMLMTAILEEFGHNVICCENGEVAVDRYLSEHPDLILMDVVMPNLNGFQATRTISRDKTTSHIPVILVTTKDQETDRVWGMRQGAKGYITKPINEGQLVKVIKEFLPG